MSRKQNMKFPGVLDHAINRGYYWWENPNLGNIPNLCQRVAGSDRICAHDSFTRESPNESLIPKQAKGTAYYRSLGERRTP